MVTSAIANDRAEAGNAYEFNAHGVLQLYAQFVEGNANCTLAVVSASTLSAKARAALEASADRLGYGAAACAWVTLDGGEGECALGSGDVRMLLEGIDPCGIVATDAAAASAVSEAYSTSLKLDSANRAACRTVVALSDFEAALDDSESKQKAWAALKKLSRR